MITDKQKEGFDDVEQDYHAQAVRLADNVRGFYPNVDIEKGENRTEFHVLLAVNDKIYVIAKDYRGVITVQRKDYVHYKNVSSHDRSEMYKLDTTQKMKVMTGKKIQAKIDAEEAYNEGMARIEQERTDKIAEFLQDVNALGLNYQSEDKKHGRAVKNGILYEYDIDESGHISQKVALSRGYYEDYIDTFLKLSENKYKGE